MSQSMEIQMSRLAELIADRKKKEAPVTLYPMTVRVQECTKAFIDAFAEDMNLSRQDALVLLLDDGITSAKRLLESQQPEAAAEANFHILNTNKEHSDDDQEMMLREHIAAAFYDPWYKNINRIKPNDW